MAIKLEEDYIPDDDIAKRYSLKTKGDLFILHDSLNKDHIQVAKEFILEMLN